MKYIEYIRAEPCVIPGCPEKSDAHHLLSRKSQGNTERNDYFAIPICRIHHTVLHQYGIAKFEEKHHGLVNVWKECAYLLREWILRGLK